MNDSRLRLDPFAFALAALALLTFGFFATRNGGAVIMCATCLGGLVAGRLVGFSNRSLVPLTLGLVVVLAVVWGELLPVSSHVNSAIAHASGGLLAGWAISEYLRDRYVWALWPLGVLLSVFTLGVLWEISEYAGDQLFGTDLTPNLRDSINDVTFGTLGGVLGMLVSALFPPASHSR